MAKHPSRPMQGPGAHKLRAKPSKRQGSFQPKKVGPTSRGYEDRPRTVPGYASEGSAHPKAGAKCGQRLANDVGKCDRVKGHTGEHSNAWYRKNRDV